MKKEPMKSFEIIKEMYEHFVKKSRKQEPKLMICEKEDFDNVENALKRQDSIEITAIDIEQDNKELCKENEKLKRVLEIIKEKVMPLISLDEGELCEGHYRVYDGELYMHTELTKEEYDLLKEALKNDR